MLKGWYRIRYADGTSQITKHPKETYLPFDEIKAIRELELRLNEIIQILEDEAENANEHSIVAMYSVLDAKIKAALETHGVNQATVNDVRLTFFRELAKSGGLVS